MRWLRTCAIICCTAVFTATVTASGEPIDPLFRNHVVGNSAEVAFLTAGLAGTNAVLGHICDYNGALAVTAGATFLPDVEGSNEWKIFDITSGDYDGNGRDEIVLAFFDFVGNGFYTRMIISSIDDGLLTWNNVYDTIIPGCQADDNWRGDQNHVQLTTGNFDTDANREFVLAFWNGDNNLISLRLYEVDSLNSPQVAASLDGEYLSEFVPEAARLDVEAGDFGGDGIDELVLVATDSVSSQLCSLYVRVYECNAGSGIIVPHAKKSIFAYGASEHPLGFESRIERVAVATGDLNNDKRDEIVAAWQTKDGYWVGNWPWCVYQYKTNTKAFMQPIRISPDCDSILYDSLNREYHDFEAAHTPCKDSFYPIWQPGPSMSVTCGDLNLDGRDEILWGHVGESTLDDAHIYTVNNALQVTEAAQLVRPINFHNPSTHTMAIADLDANMNDSIWRPEILVLDWASGQQRLKVYSPVVVSGVLTGVMARDSVDFGPAQGMAALTVGDFDGDGVKLGAPTYSHVDGIIQPTVVVHAPPAHFDVFNGITYDINECFGQSLCSSSAKYSVTAGGSQEIITEVKSDWGFSASLTYNYGCLVAGIDFNLGLNYGENFSSLNKAVYTLESGSNEDACTQDITLATRTSYDIWEYPVFSQDSALGHMLVVSPTKAQREWYYTDTWDDQKHICDHEPGNLMSYRYYSDIRLEDENIDTLIHLSEAKMVNDEQSERYWYLERSNFTENGISTGWDFGLEFGVNAYYGSWEAGINGYYDNSQIKTHRTIFNDKLKLETWLGKTGSSVDAPYRVTSYAYRAKNGALVLDYSVEPIMDIEGIPTFWGNYYGQQPDLSFVLPWKYSLEMGEPSDTALRNCTHDIIILPVRPEPGQDATLTARIRNFSMVDFDGSLEIRFYHNDPDNGGTMIGSPIVVDTFIAARRSVDIGLTWTIPEDIPKESRIYAVLDPGNEVAEIHENNNKGWARLLVPEGTPTTVENEPSTQLPDRFILQQNYPNPFNPSTNIEYNLPHRSHVMIEILNILGQKVRTLVDGEKPAGVYRVIWDGEDNSGHPASTGVYLYRLRAGDVVQTKKMLLLK